MSLLEFFYRSRVQIWTLTLEHCWLVGMSMLLAVLIGGPLGILITPRAANAHHPPNQTPAGRSTPSGA